MKEFQQLYKSQKELKETEEEESTNYPFANLKKIIIQERGEEEYNYIYNNKKRYLDSLIEDRVLKEQLQMKLDYYTNDDTMQLSYKG